ncbi:MAG: hypothetical protein J6W29_05780 [Neisseriaceae bacterium]|nr:hypothetical protein [Neisseriaceae bacterium]
MTLCVGLVDKLFFRQPESTSRVGKSSWRDLMKSNRSNLLKICFTGCLKPLPSLRDLMKSNRSNLLKIRKDF